MTYHAFLDGTAVARALADYSITDTVTSLIPGTSPGVPTFDFSVPDEHPNPLRHIRTRGVLDAEVPIVGTVTDVSFSELSGISSYSFDSDLQQLNRTMRTYRQFLNYNLLSVVEATIVSALPASINVVVTGSEYAQSLRIYTPDVYDNGIDSINNMLAANRLEMHTAYTYDPDTDSSTLTVDIREPFTHELFFKEPVEFSVQSNDSARSSTVSVTNYDYHYSNTDIIWQSDSVYQIPAGEYQEIRVTMSATPEYVSQPVCVETMLPPEGTFAPPSRYVITGSDGFIVSPLFWTQNGGRIEVELDPEVPKDLIIKIFGCRELSRSPYRLSEGEADRPALAISGTGVVENPLPVTALTSDADGPDADESLDSPMIGTRDQAGKIINGMIHNSGQPKQTINATLARSEFDKKYMLFRRERTVWNSMLPHQIASAGKKLGSGEGFYAPYGMWYDNGLYFHIDSGLALGTPVLYGDPGMLYPNVEQRFVLTGSTLPNKRKSVQFLWLSEVEGSTAYTATFRMRGVSGSVPIGVGINWYDDNLDLISTSLNTGNIASTLTNLSVSATSPAGARFASVSLHSNGTSAADVMVDAVCMDTGSTPLDPSDYMTVLPEEEVTTNFSNLPGAVFEYNDCMYRVTEATYTMYSVDIVAEEHTTLADLNARWAGKTIAELDTAWEDETFLRVGQRPLQ